VADPAAALAAAVALFAITLILDILDKYGVIHIPSWLTMDSIDDARAILSAMMGARGRDRTGTDFLGRRHSRTVACASLR
jgi:hypothetical protein